MRAIHVRRHRGSASVARRRVSVPRGVIRNRPTTNWARCVSTTFQTVGVGNKLFFASLILSNPGIGETIRRVRGRFIVFSDQVAQHELIQGALGFTLVTDAASTAGAASIPGPFTDRNDDNWFVWESMHAISTMADNTAPAAGHNQVGGVVDFDSKAMRRVEEGSQLVVMAENSNVGHVLRFSLGFSVLSSRIG